jgi:DNA-binding NarL/FixJ family response regulator
MKHPYKVLVVDDHPGIRQALKPHLGRVGTCRVVGDVGRSADLPWALQAYRPDLVVLDLELERGHVLAGAVAQIRKPAAEARVIVYSARSDFQIVTAMLDLGVA